ncbi:NAD-dependent epimerase/dehydratase family protein [Nocardia sp. NPDC051463]|uniref:dTDP-glucose 4,6-dehydratase n=1 Tax=Nocardia sp. NPDC051463 TaxID=3154845 RepID=UPI00344D6D16
MAVYLVTGAAGFIGANYVHFLLEQEPDAQVIAVDYIGVAGNVANLDQVRERISFEKADIADFAAMAAIYRQHRPDFVVNFAAESHNDRAILGPSSFMRSNALGAQVMLECSRLMPVKSHLHISTIEVYGELPTAEEWFTERSPLNAKTPYSAAKAAGDQMVRAYMATYSDMNIRLTHCANNFGPYQLPEKLIPLAVTHVLRGRKIPVYGDGLQSRDWLHVADHCSAVHQVLHAELDPISRRPRQQIPDGCRSSTSPPATRSRTWRLRASWRSSSVWIPRSGSSMSRTARTTTAATSSTRRNSRPNSGGDRPGSSSPRWRRRCAGTATTVTGGRPCWPTKVNSRSTGDSCRPAARR